MNWAAGICCHWREKNALSRSRFAACRGANTASGQSRQTHGRAGHGLPGRAVQPGQLVGAGRGEHIPRAADQLCDHAVVEVHRCQQLRVALGECSGVFVGDHGRWVRAAEDVVLGVGDDRLDGLALAGSRRRQVMVALDRGRVVRVDRGARVPGPGLLVPHRVVGGADA